MQPKLLSIFCAQDLLQMQFQHVVDGFVAQTTYLQRYASPVTHHVSFLRHSWDGGCLVTNPFSSVLLFSTILEWSKHNMNLIQGIQLCLCTIKICANEDINEQRWGLLSRFPPFHYFLNFSALSKHTLAIEYHVNIWQVSPQLNCGGTCQI